MSAGGGQSLSVEQNQNSSHINTSKATQDSGYE